MAACTACGRPLEEGAHFCAGCGAAVQTSTSTAASAVRATAPASVEQEMPLAAPPVVSPFFVIVGIVLVLLIGGSVWLTMFLRDQSKPQAALDQNTTNLADDYFRALNLGNYPGSTPAAVATLNGETVVAAFLTRDTPTQVMQFYKVRFPVSIVATEDGISHLTATLPNQKELRIDAAPQGNLTQVKLVIVR